MSSEADKWLRPWSEVAKIWNEREHDSLRPENAKEIGRQALLKLRERMTSNGERLEDLKDI